MCLVITYPCSVLVQQYLINAYNKNITENYTQYFVFTIFLTDNINCLMEWRMYLVLTYPCSVLVQQYLINAYNKKYNRKLFPSLFFLGMLLPFITTTINLFVYKHHDYLHSNYLSMRYVNR